ncbi:hypothetical protein ASPZODRAFT_48236, partial [Penicilliopsis zonata CBS 506.65]
FLSSETIALRTEDSSCRYNIHEDLLRSKCQSIGAALKGGFVEGQQRVYTCKDASDGTLIRFIEWAYRGDYAESVGTAEPKQAQPEEDGLESSTDETAIIDDIDDGNCPLLVHLALYIFGDKYLVADLKQIALKKLRDCLKQMDMPKTLNNRLAVIKTLRVAFTNLPHTDPLLAWLAQYAAYALHKLSCTALYRLLGELPDLASRVIARVAAASQPPW